QRPQLQVGIVRPLRSHARSADSMLRDPKYLRFRVFCSRTRKLRGRRVESRAKIARRFAWFSVAADAIIQIEFPAGNQRFGVSRLLVQRLVRDEAESASVLAIRL